MACFTARTREREARRGGNPRVPSPGVPLLVVSDHERLLGNQEFDLRQTSLNGHQAHLDPDGVFRGVISVTDPGVPNWLDPVGHANSLICARVLYARSRPETRLRIVPIDRLRAELHPDTPTPTAAARSEVLRRRMLGVRNRYRV